MESIVSRLRLQNRLWETHSWMWFWALVNKRPHCYNYLESVNNLYWNCGKSGLKTLYLWCQYGRFLYVKETATVMNICIAKRRGSWFCWVCVLKGNIAMWSLIVSELLAFCSGCSILCSENWSSWFTPFPMQCRCLLPENTVKQNRCRQIFRILFALLSQEDWT